MLYEKYSKYVPGNCTQIQTLYKHAEGISSPKSKLTAGHIEEGAVNGRDPEVGGASVKQHSEVLWWGANTDRSIVLSLWRQSEQRFYI